MRHPSVKVRITIWYTLLMILMAALLMGFLFLVSGSVSTQTAMDQLDQTVRDNLSCVGMAENTLQLDENFRFYDNGVYTLVYSQGESLLAGQIPVGFTADEPFRNGLTRPVDAGGTRYYVLDFWLPLDWESGVWVRGLLEAPENPKVLTNFMAIALIILPVFILFSALGGYLIARRAFRPLDQITSTAAAINEAADLSRRVDVPLGNNEFARLASTFNQMFARLERSFEAEQQFTADASHELRTPVAVIKSACEYAEKYGDTPEEQRETLAMIHRQADKMSALIGQLLSITRLDQGTDTSHWETLDLSAWAREVCREQPCPPGRLICQIQPGLTCLGDRALLTRLLQNLIDNGFKYGKPEGHVWVTLSQSGNEILLSVKDDGIGIPAGLQDKVWQRFFQADPSRSEKGGAGLGLAMVEQIARVHGGSMTLDSIPDLGSTFTLHLPARAS